MKLEEKEKVEETMEAEKETEVKEEVKEEKEDKKEKKNKQKEKIDSLEQEVASLKDKLLRNAAELENFKRRTNEERVKERKYASQDLVTSLVNIIGNLDKCVNMETDNEILKNFLIGFKMINNQLFDCLYSDGLEEIKAENEKFDPHVHQAISQEEDSTKESGIILEVMQKGYKYKDRVIRPAMVKVNK